MIHTPQFNGQCAACTGNDRGIVILCPYHAAAPELVAALEKIAAFAPGNGDVCEVIARIARAALARAKGE